MPEETKTLSKTEAENIAIKIYRESLKNRNYRLYEKFFIYISRYFMDPSEFIMNDLVEGLSENYPTGVRNNAYLNITNSYKDNISGSYLESDARTLCTTLRDLVNNLNMHVKDDVRYIGMTSFDDKLLSTILYSCPLIISPDSNLQKASVWSADQPIGYMKRCLHEPNYFFNHKAFYDMVEIPLMSTPISQSEYDFITNEDNYKNEFEKVKNITDRIIIQWFNSEATTWKEDITSLIDKNTLSREKIAVYNRVFNSISNISAKYLKFFSDFSELKDIIVLEYVFPKIIDEVVIESDELEVIKFEPILGDKIMGFIDSMQSDMDICSTDIDSYTRDLIESYNTKA